ncbi:MAG: hypothetical protein ACUVTZ_08055 [Armatimonadota bacterium]
MWKKLYYVLKVDGRPRVSTLEAFGEDDTAFIGECSIGPRPHAVRPERPIRLTPLPGGHRRCMLRCSDCESSREVLVFVSRQKAEQVAQRMVLEG